MGTFLSLAFDCGRRLIGVAVLALAAWAWVLVLFERLPWQGPVISTAFLGMVAAVGLRLAIHGGLQRADGWMILAMGTMIGGVVAIGSLVEMWAPPQRTCGVGGPTFEETGSDTVHRGLRRCVRLMARQSAHGRGRLQPRTGGRRSIES
jgi:hypothetical protein